MFNSVLHTAAEADCKKHCRKQLYRNLPLESDHDSTHSLQVIDDNDGTSIEGLRRLC